MIHVVPKPTDTPDDNSTEAVVREIRHQGGEVRFLDLDRIDPFSSDLEDALIWVCGMTQDGHQYEVLQALALASRIVNTPRSIATCASKVLTSVLIERAGIPSPKTLFTRDEDTAARFIASLGKVVIKPVYGFDGHGIFLIDSPDQLGSPPWYLQEYIPNDRDYRIFVIDGDAVGAIMRVSDTLAHNIHQGGSGIPCGIDDAMQEVAGAAARVVGVDYGGVDLLRTGDGYCVLEVNGTPNWHCMAVPIPALLASYLIEKERELHT